MKKSFLYLVIFLGIALICFSILLVFNEIKSAREGCEKIGGEYEFKVIHLCDGEPIYQYQIMGKKMWLYKMEVPDWNNLTINWSILNNS